MVSLSRLVADVPPSPTLAAAARAGELKAAGRDVISLTVGEPDFDTPQHVKQAAVEALEKGFTKYTATRGILPLREAICKKLKRDQNLDYKPQEVIVTNGGKQALATACAVLLNPGDEAIIPAPYWTSYVDMVRLVGGVPIVVQTKAEDGYLMKPEDFLKACSPRTKLLFLNTPSNPTGACYSPAELKALGDAVISTGNKELTILSDEVYEYITYDGFAHASILAVSPELRDRTLLVNAFSKSYSMTGWRVGYAAGPRSVIDALEVHQSQFTSNVCSIAQYAATRAYDDNGKFPAMMREAFAKRLEMVCDAVKGIPGIALTRKPRGAFFAFLELDGLIGRKTGSRVIHNGSDFTNYLLDDYDVVTVQGDAFGAPNSVRMSFALDESQLSRALDRIGAAVGKLS